MIIIFTEDIEIRVENVHIQKFSGVKSPEEDLFLLCMDDGSLYG